MYRILEAYLNNNKELGYGNVHLLDYDLDGHLCHARFRCENEPTEKRLTVSVWELLIYVNDNK